MGHPPNRGNCLDNRFADQASGWSLPSRENIWMVISSDEEDRTIPPKQGELSVDPFLRS